MVLPTREQILVVDDHDASIIADALGVFGKYRCITSKTSEEALSIIENERNIGMVITDQRMPGKNGTQLCLTIKELYEGNIPTILISADDRGKSEIEDIMPELPFILKPFRPQQLIDTIEQEFEKKMIKEHSKDVKKENILVISADDASGSIDSNLRAIEAEYKCIRSSDDLSILQSLREKDVGVVINKRKLTEPTINLLSTIRQVYPYINIFQSTRTGPAREKARGLFFDHLDGRTKGDNLVNILIEAFDDRYERIEKAQTDMLAISNIWGIAGLKASGKTTLINAIIAAMPYAEKVLRYTTRKLGSNEENWEDHVSVTKEFLLRYKADFTIFPHYGELVGIKKGVVEHKLRHNKEVMITLANMKAAYAVKKINPYMKMILIDCPVETAIERATIRGRDRLIERDAFNAHDEFMREADKGTFNYIISANKDSDPFLKEMDMLNKVRILTKLIVEERYRHNEWD